jgi:hypothetical protein
MKVANRPGGKRPQPAQQPHPVEPRRSGKHTGAGPAEPFSVARWIVCRAVQRVDDPKPARTGLR